LYVVPDVAPDPLLLKVTEFDTLFAVQLVHVPVRFVITPDAGVPKAGLTSVIPVSVMDSILLPPE
jgi:hypothetical protein